jgi:hypothetical protein
LAARAAELSPGSYLVAVDTPVRTYLDMIRISPGETWNPDAPGWPKLAEWENARTRTAPLRFEAFSPGEVLSTEQINALLPATAAAAAARVIDITADPYRCRTAPADATACLQSALNAAGRLASRGKPVDVLVPAGVYDHERVLEVGADVRLRGAGGTLRGTNPAASAIRLVGDRSGVLFLKVQGVATARRMNYASSGIWIEPKSSADAFVYDTLVIGNEITGTAGAHVVALGEAGGLWAFNDAHHGFSDAFHHTRGSRNCQVIANRARGPGDRGDDFYAFVGYRKDGDPVHHCVCTGNWGRDGNARGLSAVGAGFIQFRYNDIARTNWAGVYVARETSYDTYGSFSIEVVGNRVSAANLRGTHSGLLAYADEPSESSPSRSFGRVMNSVRDLIVKDNVIEDTRPGSGAGRSLGIEVRRSCVGGDVSNNTINGGKGPGLAVDGASYSSQSNRVVSDVALR